METGLPTPFFRALLARQPQWRGIPLAAAQTDPRQGVTLTVPAPPGSDLSHSLWIEDDEGEVTIGLDHSHIHLGWPPHMENAPPNPLWRDPLAFVDAVLTEKVVASSGWIDGQLRVGSLHEAAVVPDLLVPNLQHVRVRSWLGTHDRDRVLLDENGRG